MDPTTLARDAQLREFAKWVERHEPRHVPILADPFGPPVYAREYLTETVQPWYDRYRALEREHPSRTDDECPAPDPAWYTPTPRLRDLEDRLDALATHAFRQVPNPDYDPERAAAYWKQRHPRVTPPPPILS
jgi:hypothetical protein